MNKKFRLYHHQEKTIEFLDATDTAYIGSTAGCVSCDTEYLTPIGWKRIDKYTPLDMVAQWNPNNKSINYVKPINYIKEPCTHMVYINPTRGTSQKLSLEHRILYYTKDGDYSVEQAYKFIDTYTHHNTRKPGFETTFELDISNAGINLTDNEIRLQIAILADGYSPCKTESKQTVIRIKKQRKKTRLEYLLNINNIIYKKYKVKPEGFHTYSFKAPLKEKTYTKKWWNCSKSQLKIVIDEVLHWDGNISKRKHTLGRFSTTNKTDADFIQYAFAANGYRSSICVNDRTNTKHYKSVEYRVEITKQTTLVGPGRREHTTIVPTDDGYKYCFEVPSSFLLLRHNNYIFATGNTGKSLCIVKDVEKKLSLNPMSKTLILAPKSLLDTVWKQEFKDWAPQIFTSVAIAPESKRRAAFEQPANVYITNVDALTWLAKQPKSFWQNFETVVVDESTSLKNESQRGKAAMKIKKYFKYRRCLSGTPTAGPLTDLFYQYYFLDDGETLGTSYTRFRNQVMIAKQNGPHPKMVEWVNKPGREKVLAHMLAHLTIRYELEKVVDMPPVVRYTYKYKMNAKSTKAYLALKNHSKVQLDTGTVTALNASTLTNKLLQCLEKDTEVLTNTGWKYIQNITPFDKLWDGINWVSNDGVLDNGYLSTINCWGINMTTDHKLLTDKGWKTAEDIINDKSGDRFITAKVQLPNGYKAGGIREGKKCDQRKSGMWKTSKTRWMSTFRSSVNFIKKRLPRINQSSTNKISHVYDILNSGPHNRFTIRNSKKEIFISHNCAAGQVIDTEAGVAHLVDTQRYDLVLDICNTVEHSVVFFNWKAQCVYFMEQALKKGMKATFIDGSVSSSERKNRVQDFQDGNYQVIFLQPKSSAHGITLTRASYTIWAGPMYLGDYYSQGNNRVFRLGQEKRTTIINIEAEHTLDNIVYQKLNSKLTSMDLLNEALI